MTLVSLWHNPDEGLPDHQPLLTETRWRADTTAHLRRHRWNVEALRTPAGKLALQQAFDSIPDVPWTYDVDDQLQIINNHLHSQLQQRFPAVKAKPRQQHISDVQWQSIMARRQARRLIARSKHSRARYMLHAFNMWRHSSATEAARQQLGWRRRWARALLHEARLGETIRSLTCTLNRKAA